MAIAIKAMKPKKADGSSEVSAETISASAEAEISMMMELANVLDGKGPSDERQTSMLLPFSKINGDIEIILHEYRGIKQLE